MKSFTQKSVRKSNGNPLLDEHKFVIISLLRPFIFLFSFENIIQESFCVFVLFSRFVCLFLGHATLSGTIFNIKEEICCFVDLNGL